MKLPKHCSPYSNRLSLFRRPTKVARALAMTALLAAASVPFFSLTALAANTPDNFTGGTNGTATSWLTTTNWSLGALPGATNDAVFTSASPGTTASGNITLSGSSQTVGTLDDTHTAASTYLSNNSTTAASNLTLGGVSNLGNSLSGTSADLLYVAGAASTSFSIYGGTSYAFNLALGQSGNFNVGSGSTLYLGTNSGTALTGIASTLSLGANTLTTTGAGTISIFDAITGSGGLTINGAGGTTSLAATNTYGGNTSILQGTLALNFAPTTAPVSNIISTSSVLNLGGGTLSVIGAATYNDTQTFASTTLAAGGSAITQVIGNGGTTSVGLGVITRNTGSTLNLTLPAGTSVTTNTPNAATTILGGWATVNSTDFATSAGTAGTAGAITALGTYTTASTAPATDNGANINVAGNVVTTGAITPNSIRFNTAGAYTLTLTGANTVASGGILFGSGVGNNISTIGGTGSTLTSSTGDLVVSAYSTAVPVISSGVTGAIGLTKSGATNLTFSGPLTFTGGNFYVNGGFVTLSGTNSYTGQTIIAPGAAVGTSSTSLSILGATTGTGNETVVQNGGYFRYQVSGLTLAENFILSGTGAGNGAIQSYGGSNNFSGTVQLAGGTAVAMRPSTSSRTTTFTGVISDQVSGANNDLGFFRTTDVGTTNQDVFVLTNASTYGGRTIITDTSTSSATLNLSLNLQGGDNRLPTSTVVVLGGVQTINGSTIGIATGAGRLVLGTGAVAVNQTVAGLTTGGSAGNLNTVVGGASAVSTLTVNGTGNYTFGGLLGSGTAGASTANNLALTKSGSGVMTLTAANTYTGATTVNGGVLNADSTSNVPLSTGPVTVSAGNVTISDHAGSVPNFTNNFTLNGSGASISAVPGNSSGAGALGFYNSGAFSLTGTVNLASNSLIFSAPVTQTGNITFSGVISGVGALTLAGAGTSGQTTNFALSNANTYGTANATTLFSNFTGGGAMTVTLSTVNNVLPTNTVLTLGGTPSGQGGSYNANVNVALNGINQTVAGLTVGGTAAGVYRIIGNSATLSTFTVNNAADYTFSGVIGSTGTNNNNLALTKTGAGTLTLTGTSTYTGATTINGGTINLGGATANGAINGDGTTNSALVMGGGTLNYTRTGTNTQTFASTTFNSGASSITNAVSTDTLALGAITRNSGGTVNFTGPGAITTPTANTATSILGGWATYGLNDWATSAGNGTTAGNITALGSYFTYNNVSGLVGAGANGTSNLTDDSGYDGTYTNNITLNSLRFNSGSNDGNFGIVNGNNLTLNSGGILVTNNVGAKYQRIGFLNTNYNTGEGQGGITLAAAGDLVVNQNNNGTGRLEIYSAIFGTGVNLVKTGVGYLDLKGLDASYTGSTVVNGGTMKLTAATIGTTSVVINGGTLLLGANDRINNAATVTLNGGTFSTGGFKEGASNGSSTHTIGLGALTLSSTSTLDFGAGHAGSSVLAFAASSAQPWNGTLTLTNFTPGTDFLNFDTSTGLSATQLSEISLSGFNVSGLNSNGDVTFTAVPEPATWAAGILMLGALGYSSRRQVRRWVGAARSV